MGLKKKDLEAIKASIRTELDYHKQQLDYHTKKVERLSTILGILDRIPKEIPPRSRGR